MLSYERDRSLNWPRSVTKSIEISFSSFHARSCSRYGFTLLWHYTPVVHARWWGQLAALSHVASTGTAGIHSSSVNKSLFPQLERCQPGHMCIMCIVTRPPSPHSAKVRPSSLHACEILGVPRSLRTRPHPSKINFQVNYLHEVEIKLLIWTVYASRLTHCCV